MPPLIQIVGNVTPCEGLARGLAKRRETDGTAVQQAPETPNLEKGGQTPGPEHPNELDDNSR